MCPTPLFAYDLKFDGLPVQLYGPYLEIHPNSTNVALCVGVILEGKAKV